MRRLQNLCLTVAVTALIVSYAAWSSLTASTTLTAASTASAAPDTLREHSTVCQVSLQVTYRLLFCLFSTLWVYVGFRKDLNFRVPGFGAAVKGRKSRSMFIIGVC